MQWFVKSLIVFVLHILVCSFSFADTYHVIAGNSKLGYREKDQENVNLGFKSAFNTLLAQDEIQCDFKLFDSIDELTKAISNNQVNAFFGSPIEYLRTEDFFNKDALVSATFGDGKTKYKVLLLVSKDSKIQSLSELKDKRLSTNRLSVHDIPGLYLETTLLEKGYGHMKQFFSEIIYTDTSNGALVNLFFDKADAVLVTEMQFNISVELNPQLRKQTLVIAESEPYINFVAALSKTTPQEQVKKINKGLLSVEKTAKGRHVLNLMSIKSFNGIADKEFNNLRNLMKKYQGLNGVSYGS